jgi:small subunit ribosomal protein S6
MSTYESTFICSPELPAEKLDELVEKIKKIAEHSGGRVTISQHLGRKRLAYPIKKFREGSYVYMELNGSGEMINALEKFYQVNDPVIRYLTIKAEKKKVVPQKVSEPAQAEPASQEVKSNEHDQPSSTGAK